MPTRSGGYVPVEEPEGAAEAAAAAADADAPYVPSMSGRKAAR